MAHGRIVEMFLADMCGIFSRLMRTNINSLFSFFFEKAPMIM